MNRSIYPILILVFILLLNTPTVHSQTETPVEDDPVFVGAGDIASCGLPNDEATAKLLDGIEGTMFTAGDNVYNSGTASEFQQCYEPTWGRHKKRTRPSPGNHDYGSLGAAPYFDYFGENAGPKGRGYYSFDLGAWHIISLNSNIAAGANSEQVKWLRDDLVQNKAVCTLAYWHHPLFSSGAHGNDPRMKEIWKVLYESGVDVVINGHDHTYERFAQQTPDGKADPGRGIREFVVGTGGAFLYAFRQVPNANSEVRHNLTFGVLKLTLHAESYDWEFVPVAGKTFTDSGATLCVDLDSM
jgi:acid phosphatase type 7